MHRSSYQPRHMSKPIFLGFELIKVVSLCRVKKTQIFSHRSNKRFALLLLRVCPAHLLHSSTACQPFMSPAPLRRFPAPLHLLLRPTITIVLPELSRGRCTVIAPSWSWCIFFFFQQPSPSSTALFCSIRLHAIAPHRRGGCSSVIAATIASIQSRSLYVYFYVLGCFWIRLDLIFCIVCVLFGFGFRE